MLFLATAVVSGRAFPSLQKGKGPADVSLKSSFRASVLEEDLDWGCCVRGGGLDAVPSVHLPALWLQSKHRHSVIVFTGRKYTQGQVRHMFIE